MALTGKLLVGVILIAGVTVIHDYHERGKKCYIEDLRGKKYEIRCKCHWDGQKKRRVCR